MNNCSWYLWLGGKKIYNIRQLRENFDTALLIGYYIGGSLMKWLSDLGESAILDRLGKIDKSGDVGKQLEFAFGVSPDRNKTPSELPPASPAPEKAPEPKIGLENASSFLYASEKFADLSESSFSGLSESSFRALMAGSFAGLSESSFSALLSGSFVSLIESSFSYIFGRTFTSESISSFNYGSYSSFINGQALNLASAASGSYTIGSFGSFNSALAKYLELFGFGGSFALSSFTFSSFGLFFGLSGVTGSFTGSFAGSYAAWLGAFMRMFAGGSFGSFGSFGNIGDFFGEGSFRYSESGCTVTAEEYHRTLINLSSCPLNAYGYGINLI